MILPPSLACPVAAASPRAPIVRVCSGLGTRECAPRRRRRISNILNSGVGEGEARGDMWKFASLRTEYTFSSHALDTRNALRLDLIPGWVWGWMKTAGYVLNSCYNLLSLDSPHHHSRFEACPCEVTVECSNHFAHTQQFSSNAKHTLPAT